MLKIPAKYNRCGIKIKCLKCKYQLSGNTCKDTGKKLSSCEHQDQHRFNLVVCVPNSKARRTKVIQTTNFDSALVELNRFKEELKVHKFQNPINVKEKIKTTLVDLMAEFLDCMNGINTPKHRIRKRSTSHVSDCKRTFLRFCKSLKRGNYNIEILELKDITDDHISVFHEFLVDTLHLGNTTYTKHFVIMKTFFNFCIEVKKLKIENPFKGVELKIERKEKNIITKEEFEKLLGIITYENGWKLMCGKNRNHYRSWLVASIRLALETGVRTEEIFEMKYSDIVDLGNGVSVFGISNLKVNRIISGSEDGKYKKHIPITASLMQLLMELGYSEKKDSSAYIIERNGNETTELMMNGLSRGFNHYITLVTARDLKFKCLRKSYFTYMAMVLGDKTKLFTGGSDEILKNHYLSSAYIAGGLSDFKMF